MTKKLEEVRAMKDRGSLYAGALLVVLGGIFLFAQLGSQFLEPLGIRLGWGTMWPFLVLFVGFAFLLPILIWWDKRERVKGLAIPGTIITVNGLILLYQNLTGDWGSWAYVWALEPLSVGLGLILLYLLGTRERGLLVASGIVGGIGLVFFIIFASIFGSVLRFLGPMALILIGLLVLLGGARQRAAAGWNRD